MGNISSSSVQNNIMPNSPINETPGWNDLMKEIRERFKKMNDDENK